MLMLVVGRASELAGGVQPGVYGQVQAQVLCTNADVLDHTRNIEILLKYFELRQPYFLTLVAYILT